MAKAKIKPLKGKVVSITPLDGLGALDGAVKVCARYGPGKNSGKMRCLQWMSGPGYAEGPAEQGNGTTNPQYFVQAARKRPDGSPFRRYRYRSGKKPLPYPPRYLADRAGKRVFNPESGKTQALWNDLDPDVQLQIVKIVNEGAFNPLQTEEEIQILPPEPKAEIIVAPEVKAEIIVVPKKEK